VLPSLFTLINYFLPYRKQIAFICAAIAIYLMNPMSTQARYIVDPVGSLQKDIELLMALPENAPKAAKNTKKIVEAHLTDLNPNKTVPLISFLVIKDQTLRLLNSEYDYLLHYNGNYDVGSKTEASLIEYATRLSPKNSLASPEEMDSDIPHVMMYAHYNARKSVNKPEKTVSLARENGGTLQPQNKALFHQQGPGNQRNKKYIFPDGSEGVYDETGNLIKETLNRGTYNAGRSPGAHFLLDIVPYTLWGNAADDPSTLTQRIRLNIQGAKILITELK